MTLWNNYKRILFEKFDLEEQNTWADWKEKDANLVAKTYTGEHILKSREVDIWDKRANIYNNICLLYTSPSPRDGLLSRMPSSA